MLQKYFSEMGIFCLVWNKIIVCSTFARKSMIVIKSDFKNQISYLMNFPDIPFTSADAAQYRIDWAPSTGYLKKIKPIIFQQNWENREVCWKKLVWVRPGNAIFIVTLLKNREKLCLFDFLNEVNNSYLFCAFSSSALASV